MIEVPQGVRDRIAAAALVEAEGIANRGENYDPLLGRRYSVEEMRRNIQRHSEAEWLRCVNSIKLVPL